MMVCLWSRLSVWCRWMTPPKSCTGDHVVNCKFEPKKNNQNSRDENRVREYKYVDLRHHRDHFLLIMLHALDIDEPKLIGYVPSFFFAVCAMRLKRFLSVPSFGTTLYVRTASGFYIVCTYICFVRETEKRWGEFSVNIVYVNACSFDRRILA